MGIQPVYWERGCVIWSEIIINSRKFHTFIRHSRKAPRINIFKLGGAYYFKYFFDDPGLLRELEPFYEKARYRFRMATVGERNKAMKLLYMKGYDPTLMEYLHFTMEIRRYQKYGELLKNSIESYPLRDKILPVMKDLVEQAVAVAMGAVVRAVKRRFPLL